MLTTTLHKYQDSAVDQALDRGNLLIAYGMGLGKTVIQLAICEELLGDEDVSLNLLIVPSGLKWQWAQAVAQHTDVTTRQVRMKDQSIVVPTEDLCVVVDGTAKNREVLYRRAREVRPDYVIVGYANVLNDFREIRRLDPDLIALDEATAIAHFDSKTSQQVKKLAGVNYRFAATGTPINNKADELFSIMEFVDVEALGRADLFERAYISRDSYGRVQRYKNLPVLHEIIQPFTARKTRFDPDVAPYLPKDYHREEYVGLSPKARALYKKIAGALAEDLDEMVGDTTFNIAGYYSGEKANGNSQQGKVMSKLMALNMLCIHPDLLLQSAMDFDKWMEAGDVTKPSTGSRFAWELWKNSDLDFEPRSPKIERVLGDISDFLAEDPASKVLVFSFYKGTARLLAKALGEIAVVYNGDMSVADKEAAKMRFKRDPDVRVFLSSDAGGMGVDLPEANYLLNVDLPDSAGKSDQRNNRHVRASSTWDEVFIVNYLVEGSVEELRFERLDFKRRIGSSILDGKFGSDGTLVNDVETLRDFIQSHQVT